MPSSRIRTPVSGPNHRLTQPWRFYVLGPDARQAYGLVLGGRKARKIEDPDAGQRSATLVRVARLRHVSTIWNNSIRIVESLVSREARGNGSSIKDLI